MSPARLLSLAALSAASACGGSGNSVAPAESAPPATVSSISISEQTLHLVPGRSQRLTADVRLSNGQPATGISIAWTSSAPEVATVAGDGTVTAIAGGAATIAASVASLRATASVTVEHQYDLAARGVPRMVTADYIELPVIMRISRFRSGFGHDYSDDAERCRSMKHYFQPYSSANWASIRISAPVTGRVTAVLDEKTFGKQVQLVPDAYPAFTLIIFHVTPVSGLATGTRVQAGETLGTHIGSQTLSDIAILVQTPQGRRLVSYFDAMSDSVFQGYVARGIASRAELIIPAAERDASPLSCAGESFQGEGSIPNWRHF